MMRKRLYLAYGSNLNMGQMKFRCPDAKAVGTAEIKGYGLLFKGSQTGAYLTIEPKAGASVPVGVWEVTDSDERSLDRYEGCPAFYYKKESVLPIKSLEDGTVHRRKCFMYIMHEESHRGIPSLHYVSTCLQGYIDFGLDEHFLTDAQIEAEEKCRRRGMGWKF